MIETGLKDKVVVITGGAAGIGRATALRFAAEGAKVVAWDVGEAGDLEKELSDAGAEGAFARVDVTDRDAVAAATADVVERWGRYDVLVNNAGIVRDAQLVKWRGDKDSGDVHSMMSDDFFDQVIDVNLKGVFYCTRAAVPHMIRAGHGVILSASSVVAHNGNFGQTNYAATKAAVINMTRTWARELGRHGIRVNAVAPGFVGTDIVKSMPEKVLEGMVGHTPVGRMGEPVDIANAYVWLASDAASFVHGTTLNVDGGLVLGT